MAESESAELQRLRREMESSGIGSYSLSGMKLQRLIDLEAQEIREYVARSLSPLSSYTLPSLSALAREYVEAARDTWAEQDVVETELQLSLFLAWIQNSQKRNNSYGE